MKRVLPVAILLISGILAGCGSSDPLTDVGEVKKNEEAAKLQAEGKLKSGGAQRPSLD